MSSQGSPLTPRNRRLAGGTATSRFGTSRRESHDASFFYSRFEDPEICDDEEVVIQPVLDRIFCGDSREMAEVESNSVALVVTSPPYFAGKEYEAEPGRAGVPGSYSEYLDLLHDVFAECKRVLEPGGRIAVNVANLGRRPFRSLASDVMAILQHLGFLLRGEVVWWKGRGASGSCAWGTFGHPSNPVLRDVTERVVIACKGRFDRAIHPEERARRGLPHRPTITRDEFLEATLDLWEIPPESATRVGHPAPFPVELPMRLIELYTYLGDVVLDPFVGSGSTAVAAVRTGRHYLGYDTDESYVRIARRRVAEEVAGESGRAWARRRFARGIGTGAVSALELCKELLAEAGFESLVPDYRIRGWGMKVSLAGLDREGALWAFDVVGSLTSTSAGLKKKEALNEVVAKGLGIRAATGGSLPYLVLTTELPSPGSLNGRILRAALGPEKPIRDVVAFSDPEAVARLRNYARGTSSQVGRGESAT